MLGLEQYATESQETKEKVSFGSLFLDQVLPKIESKEIRFGLSATGHVDDYSGQFCGPFVSIADRMRERM